MPLTSEPDMGPCLVIIQLILTGLHSEESATKSSIEVFHRPIVGGRHIFLIFFFQI